MKLNLEMLNKFKLFVKSFIQISKISRHKNVKHATDELQSILNLRAAVKKHNKLPFLFLFKMTYAIALGIHPDGQLPGDDSIGYNAALFNTNRRL